MSRPGRIALPAAFETKTDVISDASADIFDFQEKLPGEADRPTISDGLRSLWQYRREQVDLFPECVLNYPSWDIVLLCHIGQSEGHPLCVKQIECQLAETHAALLRRITAMENAGILIRYRDDGDWRRTLVMLTADGMARMHAFLKLIGQSGLALSAPEIVAARTLVADGSA